MAIYTTPIPGAGGPGGYAGAANTAKLAYDQAVTQIGQKRSDLLRQYGYKASFDPTSGQMSGLSVDAGNPFGSLQSMLRNQSQQDDQAVWGAQDRGLHGGLANQAASNLKYQHGYESSQLGQGLVGGVNSLTNEFTNAGTNYNNALYQAQQYAAQNAIDNGQFNQADYSGLDAVPYGDNGVVDNGGGGGGTGTTTTKPISASKAATISKVSAAALAKAKRAGASAPAAALAARSAGMNAAYNAPVKTQTVAAKVIKNAYTTGQKKRG